MAVSLIRHGAIRTTEAKAKELRRYIEKLITIARTGTLHARRRVIAELGNPPLLDEEGQPLEQTAVQKLFDEIATRYEDRPGGYTRIIRLADRRIGDAGVQVLLQLVEETPAEPKEPVSGRARRRRRAAEDAAGEATEEVEAPAEADDEESSEIGGSAEDSGDDAAPEPEDKGGEKS